MNQSKVAAPRKVSQLDRTIDRYTVLIFLGQLLLVLCFGVLAAVYAGTDDDRLWYLAWHGEAAQAHSRHSPAHLPDAIPFVDEPIDVQHRADIVAQKLAARLRGVQPVDDATTSGRNEDLRVLHPWYSPLVLPLRFLLLSSMMIPISLKVTLDLIKLWYAHLVTNDITMFDASLRIAARAVNTAVTEDLGRVELVLTDKTGTLTENRMRCAAMSVGGQLFGLHHVLAEHVRNPRLHANVPGHHLAASVSNGDAQLAANGDTSDTAIIKELQQHIASQHVRTFMTTLALCHAVTPEYVNAVRADSAASPLVPGVASLRYRAIRYISASPDEEALVLTTARAGVTLCDRIPLPAGAHKLLLRMRTQELPATLPAADCDTVWESDDSRSVTFTVLHTLEFTSDRRRMSVLVRASSEASPLVRSRAPAESDATASFELESGDLFLLTKGADDVVLSRCAAAGRAPSVEAHLEVLAQHGLRTLVVAARRVAPEEYTKWKHVLEAAQIEVGPTRQAALDAAYDAIENGLTVLGCTAIEDKLQDGVPETITALRSAGLGVWMLTGDKYSTALQIARSAHLLTPLVASDGVAPGTASIISIRGHSAHAVDEQLQQGLAQAAAAASGGTVCALVIEGHALRYAVAEHRAAMLLQLATRCTAVVCCRSTPSQKAALAKLVQSTGKVVCCIGDGGNDVAMLQAANVGVGLHGREGQQAARAADFAVSRFRHLSRLVFVHGRFAHRRTATIAQYTFYKSMCVCAVQMLYNSLCAFSGCSLLDTFALTTYNMLYTFMPGLALVLDRDHDTGTLMTYPQLYAESRRGKWLTPDTFRAWSVRAWAQALVLLYTCVRSLGVNSATGDCVDQTALSYTVFSSLVVIQLCTVLIEAQSVTLVQVWVSVGCGALYFLLLLVREAAGAQVLSALAGAPASAPTFMLACTVCLLPVAWIRWTSHAALGPTVLLPSSIPSPPSPVTAIPPRSRSVGDSLRVVGHSFASAVQQSLHDSGALLSRAMSVPKRRVRRDSSGSSGAEDAADEPHSRTDENGVSERPYGAHLDFGSDELAPLRCRSGPEAPSAGGP